MGSGYRTTGIQHLVAQTVAIGEQQQFFIGQIRNIHGVPVREVVLPGKRDPERLMVKHAVV